MPKHNQYPNVYYKVYNPRPDGPFGWKITQEQSIVTDNEKGIRVSVLPRTHTDRFSHLQTVHDLFENGLNVSGTAFCMGSRSSVKKPHVWFSYKQVEEKICAFGSALMETVGYKQGMENFVGIYARNSPAWIITQQACAAYSYIYVPMYDTLGKQALQHILVQTGLKVLLCHSAKEATFCLKDLAVSLDCLIIVTESELADKLRLEFQDKLKIFYFQEFLELGLKNPHPKQVPNAADLCTVCYTSGSTGIPKGVMVTHNQMVDAVLSVIDTLDGKYIEPATVHLSYLPLCHVLEQLISCAMFVGGARVAYLTGGLDTFLADLRDVKPTILGAVPRVLNRFHTEFYKKLPKISCIRNMIQKCIEKKLAEQAEGKYNHCSLVDCLFLARFRKIFGGRVCGIVSGGAPLVPEVCRFFRGIMGCPVVEGYGSSETMGILAFGLIGDPECGIIGAPATGVELRLADVPQMGIVVSRDGIGEICARGLRCTKGYYKDAENTKALYDSDGWLHTGDIGQWTSAGALKIVDRCNNMFKLARGEYIAPEKVEAVYQCSPLVTFIFVDGDSTRTYAVAVVHPDFNELRAQLRDSGIQPTQPGKTAATGDHPLSNEELCDDIAVRKFVLKQMNAVARNHGLRDLELVQAIHLTPEPFTIANGLLTPAMKIARFTARNVFKTRIRRLYEDAELKG